MAGYNKKHKAFIIVMIVLSVLAFPLGVLLLYFVGEEYIWGAMDVLRKSWVILLVLPIPLTTLIISCKLERGPLKKAGIIVSIIMSVWLTIWGLVFIYPFDNVSKSRQAIVDVEQQTGLQFPHKVEVITIKLHTDWTVARINDSHEIMEFEQAVSNDSKWNTVENSLMQNINRFDFYLISDFEGCDFVCFFNKTTNEFNKMPTEGFENYYIVIGYDKDYAKIVIHNNYLFD
ncbi:MAG: hypothetical protein J6C23_03455 [Clostridia bacterium]|nr:hypothetical protein [Clostridia bacterium]